MDKRIDFIKLVVSFILVFTVLFLFGCAGPSVTPSLKPASPTPLPSIHYTIQVGAFSNMDNAVRFTDKLRNQDVNAYHFLHHSGLYKVRFSAIFPPERLLSIGRKRFILRELSTISILLLLNNIQEII